MKKTWIILAFLVGLPLGVMAQEGAVSLKAPAPPPLPAHELEHMVLGGVVLPFAVQGTLSAGENGVALPQDPFIAAFSEYGIGGELGYGIGWSYKRVFSLGLFASVGGNFYPSSLLTLLGVAVAGAAGNAFQNFFDNSTSLTGVNHFLPLVDARFLLPALYMKLGTPNGKFGMYTTLGAVMLLSFYGLGEQTAINGTPDFSPYFDIGLGWEVGLNLAGLVLSYGLDYHPGLIQERPILSFAGAGATGNLTLPQLRHRVSIKGVGFFH